MAGDTLRGVTASGFPYEIPEERYNDWEVVETISEMEDNPARVAKLAKLLLGKEQYKALKRHCMVGRRVDAERMGEEIDEIMSREAELKNLDA